MATSITSDEGDTAEQITVDLLRAAFSACTAVRAPDDQARAGLADIEAQIADLVRKLSRIWPVV